MTGPEQGFLLLTSPLGDPQRKILTMSQLRILSSRVKMAEKSPLDRELQPEDLLSLGYRREMAQRIWSLLQDRQLLQYYCAQAAKQDCRCLTWATADYPGRLKQRLGEETPGCIWCKGDLSLLTQPKVALVGSRDLQESNRHFAREVGRQAALQGYVLVSGNARGADQTAQNACLRAGGRIISIVADSLAAKPARENVLYLSEGGFDLPFSAQRAISRNRLIHALAEYTFVAQAALQTGGTWDSTVKNLRHRWSGVYCFSDGSPAALALQDMGAEGIAMDQLQNFETLPRETPGFLED